MTNINFSDENRNRNGIRIKYFPLSLVHANYYELYFDNLDGSSDQYDAALNRVNFPDIQTPISPSKINAIQYVHEDKPINLRELSYEELVLLNDLMMNINFKFGNISEGSTFLVNPNIQSSIQIQSNSLVVFKRWTTMDTMNEPEGFKPLLNLIEVITNLININFSNLNMPKYL